MGESGVGFEIDLGKLGYALVVFSVGALSVVLIIRSRNRR